MSGTKRNVHDVVITTIQSSENLFDYDFSLAFYDEYHHTIGLKREIKLTDAHKYHPSMATNCKLKLRALGVVGMSGTPCNAKVYKEDQVDGGSN